ncbi:hypothetical protein [Borrelia puertoricensis]|uniref:hypothetical protein n=1 Tax=Borrelia puertoricensis TaxID=2756107 RepID=UPI001FF0FFAF|nr:hypothetical protein [Borrelia puertoricensis]UPA19030.1 hypothetical protein bpuSUM_001568 [Borrelia puertoricensis]
MKLQIIHLFVIGLLSLSFTSCNLFFNDEIKGKYTTLFNKFSNKEAISFNLLEDDFEDESNYINQGNLINSNNSDYDKITTSETQKINPKDNNPNKKIKEEIDKKNKKNPKKIKTN